MIGMFSVTDGGKPKFALLNRIAHYLTRGHGPPIEYRTVLAIVPRVRYSAYRTVVLMAACDLSRDAILMINSSSAFLDERLLSKKFLPHGPH